MGRSSLTFSAQHTHKHTHVAQTLSLDDRSHKKINAHSDSVKLIGVYCGAGFVGSRRIWGQPAARFQLRRFRLTDLDLLLACIANGFSSTVVPDQSN